MMGWCSREEQPSMNSLVLGGPEGRNAGPAPLQSFEHLFCSEGKMDPGTL
jgi:hypothetical protein